MPERALLDQGGARIGRTRPCRREETRRAEIPKLVAKEWCHETINSGRRPGIALCNPQPGPGESGEVPCRPLYS